MDKQEMVGVAFTAAIAALTVVVLHKYWRTREWLGSDAGVFLAPPAAVTAATVVTEPAEAPLAILAGGM